MERALPSVNDGEPWVWESRQFKTFSSSTFQIFHNGYMMLLSYERKTLKKKSTWEKHYQTDCVLNPSASNNC